MVNLMVEVLTITAPVMVLAGIGFGWVRLGLAYDVAFVTRLAMSLAIPALIFVSLMRTEVDPDILADTALAALMAYVVVALVAWGLLRVAGLDMRTFLAPVTFGNTGNLGLPLALFAFGATGLDYAVVVFAVMTMLSFTFGVWHVSGHGSPLTAFREPMVWATFLGGVCLTMGWQTPQWATNTLELIGQMGIPLMLMTLGVAISRLSPSGVGRAVVLSLAKLMVCVAVAVSAGTLMGLPQVAVAVLTLQVATPVAVTNYMLAEKYGADASEVAGLVVISTLMAVLSIPVLLSLKSGNLSSTSAQSTD